MNWIQNISSTLQTWVFKKKLLKFSDRFQKEPLACFYCPEMCRFSCPTAETLKRDTVTPKGKMSLLHLRERGYSIQEISGNQSDYLWTLEQCTGCGRCTEFCVYENDVASFLRKERSEFFKINNTDRDCSALEKISGNVLFCLPSHEEWWKKNKNFLIANQINEVLSFHFPVLDWEWGKTSQVELKNIGHALRRCKKIWVESPELAWFFAKGLKEELGVLKAEVRTVWQLLYAKFASLNLGSDVIVHESSYLVRALPRLGYSIPMYEKGMPPFHYGWNAHDCGGEGFYHLAHAKNADEIADRFLFDIKKDGRQISKIICQNKSCLEHLKSKTNIPISYWLDELTDLEDFL